MPKAIEIEANWLTNLRQEPLLKGAVLRRSSSRSLSPTKTCRPNQMGRRGPDLLFARERS
jgi:hypothetical protein